MGSQIQKSHVNIKAHISQKIERPQAKAVFMEVRVNDPGAPINSFLVESNNFLNDNKMLNSKSQDQDKNNSPNFEENKNPQNPNNQNIKSVKGILKKQSNKSRSSSRYFNEEAKFVRFQLKNTHFSLHKHRDVEKLKKSRKSRISTQL
ncbi:unnamed protein product [Paramecium pentaurelia]|uniref:Uncharacterized protein n=1 Tax=Paramecium pentaurelia TaxID=43138 RepID=A0A8S1VVU0_9CILI|nr:unnamed protein product [Paramecium pentaurelia]